MKKHRAQHLTIAVLCTLTAVLVAACNAPDGNAENGKRWYNMHNCFACHGPNGNDGKAPKINARDMSWRAFLSVVRNANSPIMPKFPEEKIPKQDVADIYAWLQTRQ